MNRRLLIALLVLGAMGIGFGVAVLNAKPVAQNTSEQAQQAAEQAKTPEATTVAADPRLAERFIGKADAPVTIIEYASLTCSHCAHFQKEILPKLKQEFVDTGKVKLIFRDFPLDGTALKAAAVARCMPENAYHAFLNILFSTQDNWAFGKEDPMAGVIQNAKLGGLSLDQANICLADTKLLDGISAIRLTAQDKYKIESTPTFILNDGADKIMGAQPIEVFREKINKLLPATAK